MNTPRFFLIIGMIGAAALTRVLPHPANFAPLNALALFAGATMADRKYLAIIVPLLAMLVSDTLLHALTGWGFHADMWIVYATIVLITLLGFRLAPSEGRKMQQRSVLRIAGFGALAAVLFFIITNFVPWALHGMYGFYPRTAEGLIACFLAALPFFQNSLLGDAVYISLLFGALAFAERWVPQVRANNESFASTQHG